MTTVAQDEAQRSIADCIAATAKEPVLLERNGQPVAALISIEDFEVVRRAKVERLLASFAPLAEGARRAGLTEDDLEAFLAE